MPVCARECASRCVNVCVCVRVSVQGCVCARPRARGSAAARPAGSPGAGASPSAPHPQNVEAAMRLPLAFAVLLLASAQALAEEMGATDDLSYWSDWSDGDQAKVSPGGRCSARRPRGDAGAGRGMCRCRALPGGGGGSGLNTGAVTPQEELPLPLEHFLQRMARRPRPQQFFGLMGKRDAGERDGGGGSVPLSPPHASSPSAPPNFTAVVTRF